MNVRKLLNKKIKLNDIVKDVVSIYIPGSLLMLNTMLYGYAGIQKMDFEHKEVKECGDYIMNNTPAKILKVAYELPLSMCNLNSNDKTEYPNVQVQEKVEELRELQKTLRYRESQKKFNILADVFVDVMKLEGKIERLESRGYDKNRLNKIRREGLIKIKEDYVQDLEKVEKYSGSSNSENSGMPFGGFSGGSKMSFGGSN